MGRGEGWGLFLRYRNVYHSHSSVLIIRLTMGKGEGVGGKTAGGIQGRIWGRERKAKATVSVLF